MMKYSPDVSVLQLPASVAYSYVYRVREEEDGKSEHMIQVSEKPIKTDQQEYNTINGSSKRGEILTNVYYVYL